MFSGLVLPCGVSGTVLNSGHDNYHHVIMSSYVKMTYQITLFMLGLVTKAH